jgi:hypothetical protein
MVGGCATSVSFRRDYRLVTVSFVGQRASAHAQSLPALMALENRPCPQLLGGGARILQESYLHATYLHATYLHATYLKRKLSAEGGFQQLRVPDLQ